MNEIRFSIPLPTAWGSQRVFWIRCTGHRAMALRRRKVTNTSNQSWQSTRYVARSIQIDSSANNDRAGISSAFSVRPSSFSKTRRMGLFTFVGKGDQHPFPNLAVKFQIIFARSHPSSQIQWIRASRNLCRPLSLVQRLHRKRSDSAQSCWSYVLSKQLPCRKEMPWLLCRDRQAHTRLKTHQLEANALDKQ
jgi:hypothetical protein